MALNGISTLPTKTAKRLAKLDIAQATRQGYATVVHSTGTQDYNTVSIGNFGAIKVVSNGAGQTYLVFEYPIADVQGYLDVGSPLHNVRFAGNDHIDAASIAGPLVDCSTLVGFPQANAKGYLLSATLGVTTNNNVGILSFWNGRFTGSGSASTTTPYYRTLNIVTGTHVAFVGTTTSTVIGTASPTIGHPWWVK